MVSVGFVLAGEISAMPADSNTGWMAWPTEELSGPTTPTTSSSAASLVAALRPASGLAWSSSATNSSVQPSIVPASFACLTARSTELRMPAPKADSPPDSGAMSAILATLASSAAPPPVVLSAPRVPQPARAIDATSSPEIPAAKVRRFVTARPLFFSGGLRPGWAVAAAQSRAGPRRGTTRDRGRFRCVTDPLPARNTRAGRAGA